MRNSLQKVSAQKVPGENVSPQKAPLQKTTTQNGPIQKTVAQKPPLMQNVSAERALPQKAPPENAPPQNAARIEQSQHETRPFSGVENQIAQVQSPPTEIPKEATPGISRSNSWREYTDVDPLYALIGELSENKIVTSNGLIDEDCLAGYLNRLMRVGIVKNIKKDWIEVYAAMNIPIEAQAQVVQGIVEAGLRSEVADTVPEILAELVKGHRVKVKAVEEAIQTLFECGHDEKGCLSKFLLLIFPKSPTSEWGWSRVGWSWQQWWGTTERILAALDPSCAYDCLCELLRAVESESGGPLPGQQIWDEKRLGTVRGSLCQYGSFFEDELSAAFDLCLS